MVSLQIVHIHMMDLVLRHQQIAHQMDQTFQDHQ